MLSRSRRAPVWLMAGLALALVPIGAADARPPSTPDAEVAAARYEAESATISQGLVESNHAGFSGTGFVNYDNVTGSSVQFQVTAAQAGAAILTFGFANGTPTNRPMNIIVNGTTVAGAKPFQGTGAWTNWQQTAVNANLTAGTNTVRAVATTANGGPNVDYLELGSPGQPGATPVAANGQLRVCGTQLCNQNGTPIQLRGMSTHGLQWYRQCVNDSSLDALANDWQADIVRLSMYIQEGGYDTNPRMFTDLMHQLIDQVSARGMYVIVDWHMLDPGDPHANLEKAKTFFTEIAQRHKDKPNVLYEVANEPSGVSWSRIKSYHEQIVPVIRAQDPDAVVLLGTRAWSSLGVSDGGNEQEVIDSPVNASNVMYTFHFYAASHGSEYRTALSRAADRIPMFVTEFGTQEYTGDGPDDFNSSQQYLDLLAQKKISWTNWNYSDDERTGAAFTQGTCPNGPYAGTSRLKEAGSWVRDRIRTADSW
ncbi:cellulase family glycosylhydrolase [Tenggerimyces flavus]|uniref:cellulase n=1 Tax=Tenggerimyces flavus TaxID=1708749 RepID=A0ABV7YH74_9ACTN|nr:cellulase family glycosylhydrolase [Tenggerimyces flavus]